MKKVVIGLLLQEIIITSTYSTHLELDIYLKIFMTYIKSLISLQTYIEFNI